MSQKLFAVIITAALSITAHAKQIETKGSEFRPLIVGGVVAEKGEFPFQVSMQSSSGSHFCGGSLIKKNWILTAAHCVASWSKTNKIVIGLHDQKNKVGTETFTSVKVVAHPLYNRSTLDYDYAVIQLSGDSKFRTIDLNTAEIEIPELDKAPLNVWTSGWGTTSEGSYALPNLLNKVEIPLVTTKNCNAATAYNGDITDRMICAGLPQGGKDSCQGDSGGPLFVKQTSGDYLLVGVVSWGEGCARPNKFGVYSKVNVMVDWIAQQTQ
ncbi:MAG: serine protease [Pseudobdellovibrio sp.]